jgi:hypothetical protein
MICVGVCNIDHVHEGIKGQSKTKPTMSLALFPRALMAKQVGVARFPLYSMLNPSSASHPFPFARRLLSVANLQPSLF